MCCNQPQKLVGLLCCLALPLVTGCYSMNGYMMNASGQGYYDRGNYAMASQEFQAAVSSNPRNPDYLANLAKSRVKLGDVSGAEQLYQQALATSPAHQPAYHGYAELMLAQNRSQDALRMMNSWAATQPYIAESHVELAWVQRELGQQDAAARSLQAALQVNPSHATALAHLGQYYHDSGNSTQAVAMYQQSLRADWNQPEVHSRLAMAAEAAGPGHPMSEMAMSRGVQPGNVPRSQFAFGGPPQTPQMAYQQAPGIASGPPQSFAHQPAEFSPGGFNPMMHIPAGNGTITDVVPAPVESSASAPVPDPAFSSSQPSVPVTSVSNSTVVDSDMGDFFEPEASLPEIEAF